MSSTNKIKALFFLSTLLMSTYCASSQSISSVAKSSGIYLSKEDFLNNRISLFAEHDNRNSIEQKLDDVILTRDGEKHKLAFGTFYGYCKDGVRFRSYSNGLNGLSYRGYYKIESDSNIVIYSKRVYAPKTSGRTWYYYSETLDSPMKRLTIKNMRKDFPGQPEYMSVAKSVVKLQPSALVKILN